MGRPGDFSNLRLWPLVRLRFATAELRKGFGISLSMQNIHKPKRARCRKTAANWRVTTLYFVCGFFAPALLCIFAAPA